MDRQRLRLVVAVVATIGASSVTLGLSYPLLTLVLEDRGVAAGTIGVNAAMTPLGVLLIAGQVPRLARAVGTVRLAFIALFANAVLFVSFGLVESLVWWFPARFLLGCAAISLYVLSETWMNQLAGPHDRGRLMAIYATVTSLGFGGGPALLAVIGSQGLQPFIYGAMAMLAAALILLFGHRGLPESSRDHVASLRGFARAAPILLLATAAFAFFDQGVLVMLPLFLFAYDIGERLASLALTVLILGNVVLQFPIGWLADRISRRSVFIACAATTALIAAGLPWIVQNMAVFWLAMLIWGSSAFGVYTMSLAELGDRFTGQMLIAGNAAFGVMWGVGGLFGGPSVGAAIELFGANMMPAIMALTFGALTAVLVFRPTPRPQQEEDPSSRRAVVAEEGFEPPTKGL